MRKFFGAASQRLTALACAYPDLIIKIKAIRYVAPGNGVAIIV
jgi:hypothetical protein